MSDLPQSAPDLKQIYRERFSGSLEYRRRVWKTLASTVFAAWIPADSVVLDLGCGYCEFINHIQARKKYGMDLNPDAAGHAAAGVTVIEQDCSQAWPIPPDTLDVVFTSNFLEHLPTKTHLERTLQQVWLTLKPGGTVIAMGPNIKYVPGAYWDFYDHHIALTELSLAEILRKCGFVLERVTGRFLPYTMSSGKTYPMWMLQVYLSLPLIWPLFGKQFLVVARKPEPPMR